MVTRWLLVAAVSHGQDGAERVAGDQQRVLRPLRKSDRAVRPVAASIAAARVLQKWFNLAGRHSRALKGQANHLVPCRWTPIPGIVKSHNSVVHRLSR